MLIYRATQTALYRYYSVTLSSRALFARGIEVDDTLEIAEQTDV
jgi:hypothetical protein